jgi:3-hydroxybutyryl-CoA dehydratase
MTQSLIDAYAELTLDNNPLHVDPTYAAAGPFGRTIAHGTIPCTVLLDLASGWLDLSAPIVAQFKFVSPAYSEEALDLSVAAGSSPSEVSCQARQDTRVVVVGSVREGG